MNIKDYKKNIRTLLEEQRAIYPQNLYMSGSCSPNSSVTVKISVSNYGNFLVDRIYGTYSTLQTVDAVLVDDGVCRLKGKLTDSSVNRPLFDDFIPFDLWLSPGRKKTGFAGDVSPFPNQLFYPLPFPYIFSINSDILLDVQSSSNMINSFELMFAGYRLGIQGGV